MTESISTDRLTGEQRAAADGAIRFLRERRPGSYRIGGYAGTGKTTVARVIVEEAGLKPAVCAFTGQASDVLRAKGLDQAQTIHSTIYTYDGRTQQFILRSRDELEADYLLIDEGSTISDDIWQDVQTFRMPVVVIGDPGQLEPIGKDPGLMRDPDIVLQEIHRQAKDNPVIRFAHHVRQGGRIERYGSWDGRLRIAPRGTFWQWLHWADRAVCGFNRTRVAANRRIREHLGYADPLEVGERIVCLANNRPLGVYNGQLLTVAKIHEPLKTKGGKLRDPKVDLVDQRGMEFKGYRLHMGHFDCEQSVTWDEVQMNRDRVIADRGVCVTVHKMQGSEDERILVIDEQCDRWDRSRWRYTAATRTRHQLAYCI